MFPDDVAATVVATWSDDGPWLAAGWQLPLDNDSSVARVYHSGRAARVDAYSEDEVGELAGVMGVRSSVAAPIVVGGKLWGAISVASRMDDPLPADAETRIIAFSEVVATAISNASARAELVASRARIVAAGDEARRRIQRDLHDGTQQRLVSLALDVRAAEADVPPGLDDLHARLSGIATGLTAALEDLQEISRGIHPAVLAKGGLEPALKALAHRSAIPVDLEISTQEQIAGPIEVAVYFVASEALANAAKHSRASRIDVSLEQRDRTLLLSVRDDGVGGADAARGSGLVGLTDRVEALGGSIDLTSVPGEGTQLTAEFPRELELPR
jgi:signal transduction histidine kinase